VKGTIEGGLVRPLVSAHHTYREWGWPAPVGLQDQG
jgi:hypothetical protein